MMFVDGERVTYEAEVSGFKERMISITVKNTHY